MFVGSQTYHALAAAALPLLRHFPTPELPSLLFTLTRAGAHSPALLAAAASRILPHLGKMTSRELATLAATLAEAGFVHEMLLEGIAARAVSFHGELFSHHAYQPVHPHAASFLGDATGSEGSQIIQAYVLLGPISFPSNHSSALCSVQPPHPNIGRGSMERSDIARLVSAFSTLQVFPRHVFAELAPKAQQYIHIGMQMQRHSQERDQYMYIGTQRDSRGREMRRGSGDREGPKRQAWQSRAAIGAADPPIRQQSAVSSSSAAPPLTTPTYIHTDLADLAWAYGQAGYHHFGLFDTIAEQATAVMPSFDARLLGRLCFGFRQARHHHPALLEGVAGRAMQLAEAGGWRVGAEAGQGLTVGASPAPAPHISGGISSLAYLYKFGHDCRALLQVCRTNGSP